MKKTLTTKDLIAKKTQIEKKKTRVFELEVGDLGVFKFKTLSKDEIEDARQYKDGEEFEEYTIAESMLEPNLADKEVLEAFGVDNKIDVVRKIFLAGEIARLSTTIVKKAGYEDEVYKEVETLKN